MTTGITDHLLFTIFNIKESLTSKAHSEVPEQVMYVDIAGHFLFTILI